jgi:cyclase
MASQRYARGLHEVGDSAYAYLQPDGSWGWSNAGLIVAGEATLLVDTLFDLPLTAEMLRQMRRAVPAAASIDTLVNTHADPDHTFGNQLVGGAEIVASARTASEMRAEQPEELRQLLATQTSGAAGRFIQGAFSAFDFSEVVLVKPSRTFEGTASLRVGGLEVELIEVGPAHTRGDTLVHLPGEGVVFAGDILFAGVHPVTWDGSVGGWIAACERLLALEPEVVVPGHGPISDAAAVRSLRDYLVYVQGEAAAAHEAGLDAREAARRIDLSEYADWLNPERILVVAAAAYRELEGDTSAPDQLALLAEMGEAAG